MPIQLMKLLWKPLGMAIHLKYLKDLSKKKQDLVFHSALKKNKEWHYEDEVRYVRFLQKNESVIEEGWKVEELYLGYKYLENSNDKLGNILKILDICRKKNIKVYTMSFDFNKQKKQFKLQVNKWIKNKQSLEIENYSRIKRCVLQKLKDRILNSTEGIVLKEIIEEVAKEQFKKNRNEESIISKLYHM